MSKSEWTITTLYTHVLSLIKGVRLEYRQTFRSLQRAVDKAEASQKERDAKNNEFRLQLSDQADTFATKSDLDNKNNSLDATIEANRKVNEQRFEDMNKQISAINLSLKDVVLKTDFETRLAVLQSQINTLNSANSNTQGQEKQQERGTANERWAVMFVAALPGVIFVVIEIIRLATGK